MNENLRDYYNTFIPSKDRYSVKPPNGDKWLSRYGTPSQANVLDHLTNIEGARVACKSKWYPYYGLIDFDDWPLPKVDQLRASMGLDSSNSFLFESESANSYHLYFKPRYGEQGNMITTKLLHDALGPFITKNKAELYPHKNRVVRLPFGARSSFPVDPGRELLTGWEEKLYWLDKIDEFDISTLPIQLNLFKDYTRGHFDEGKALSAMNAGRELLQSGIQAPRTRNHSQFCILYHLFRMNETPEAAIRQVKAWIRKKHNGLSRDVNRARWSQIDREIETQAWTIYDNYTLPDIPHNQHFGSLAKDDIIEAAKLSRGNIPRFKFLFDLLRWYRVRAHRETVRCHSDHFRRWAGGTYQSRLRELEKIGLMSRGTGYRSGLASKRITVNYQYSGADPVLIDGRAGNFTETLTEAFTMRDLRQLMLSSGMSATAFSHYVKSLFQE